MDVVEKEWFLSSRIESVFMNLKLISYRAMRREQNGGQVAYTGAASNSGTLTALHLAGDAEGELAVSLLMVGN